MSFTGSEGSLAICPVALGEERPSHGTPGPGRVGLRARRWRRSRPGGRRAVASACARRGGGGGRAARPEEPQPLPGAGVAAALCTGPGTPASVAVPCPQGPLTPVWAGDRGWSRGWVWDPGGQRTDSPEVSSPSCRGWDRGVPEAPASAGMPRGGAPGFSPAQRARTGRWSLWAGGARLGEGHGVIPWKGHLPCAPCPLLHWALPP